MLFKLASHVKRNHIEGSTCVGDNTVLEREILSFTFNSPEYSNTTLDKTRFYQINEALYDELSTLIMSPVFDPVKQALAKELYSDGDTGKKPGISPPS